MNGSGKGARTPHVRRGEIAEKRQKSGVKARKGKLLKLPKSRRDCSPAVLPEPVVATATRRKPEPRRWPAPTEFVSAAAIGAASSRGAHNVRLPREMPPNDSDGREDSGEGMGAIS